MDDKSGHDAYAIEILNVQFVEVSCSFCFLF